jgi:act minimal PKS acyl carrier protein
MNNFTLADLVVMLRACAGQDESVDLDGDIRDSLFGDLGYDSLALFNTVSRIERERGISLDDDAVAAAATPRDLLEMINSRLGQLA